jgi:hypothetical protein
MILTRVILQKFIHEEQLLIKGMHLLLPGVFVQHKSIVVGCAKGQDEFGEQVDSL